MEGKDQPPVKRFSPREGVAVASSGSLVWLSYQGSSDESVVASAVGEVCFSFSLEYTFARLFAYSVCQGSHRKSPHLCCSSTSKLSSLIAPSQALRAATDGVAVPADLVDCTAYLPLDAKPGSSEVVRDYLVALSSGHGAAASASLAVIETGLAKGVDLSLRCTYDPCFYQTSNS